ncbi:MAG: alpha/beta fold hydrolase [Promethearchaeota archaeon]
MHYSRTGGNKPPLILSHGITDSGLCWVPIARDLEEFFDIIMVDARGHGLSESPPTGYSVETMVKDLIGLIKGLELDRPILMGHSMGAQISARTASLAPHLVDKLILEDPAFNSGIPLVPHFIFKRVMKFLLARMLINPLKDLSPDEIQAKCKKDNPKWSEDEILHWTDSKVQFLQKNPIQMIGSLTKSMPKNWGKMVTGIECPVLLIISDKGMTKKEVAIELTEKIWKNSEFVEIKNAGHNIRRENSVDFMKAVKGFLAIE